MEPAARTLVFDIGGTRLRAAVFDGESGRLSAIRIVDAPSYVRHPTLGWDALRQRLIEDLSALRAALDPRGELAAVVAFPGPLDSGGRVVAGPTLWGPLGLYPYALEDDLRRAWPGIDVAILNDVSAAGYRYLVDADDEFCIVTLSTGIGNKVFVRGQPLTGPSGRGGEIGHWRVDMSEQALPCDCGGRGHLITMASGRGIVLTAQRAAATTPQAFEASLLAGDMGHTPASLTAEALASAYLRSDPWAAQVVDAAAGAVAMALSAIHLAIGIERFVLIGGLAFGLGDRFRDEVLRATNARCWLSPGPGSSAGTRAVAVSLGKADGTCALVGGGRARQLGLL